MCSPKEVMLWWIGRCISSDPLSPALQAGHLLQEVSPHAELPPMFCGPLASKGKAKATVIHLLSLGPGRQVAPCPVTNQCSFTYRILETTPHFYHPQEIPGVQAGVLALWGLPCVWPALPSALHSWHIEPWATSCSAGKTPEFMQFWVCHPKKHSNSAMLPGVLGRVLPSPPQANLYPHGTSTAAFLSTSLPLLPGPSSSPSAAPIGIGAFPGVPYPALGQTTPCPPKCS